nr:4-hydroxythreonine-4-phosphate dehydrogenase PdxA [Pseudodesulfovibrio piezophilus]
MHTLCVTLGDPCGLGPELAVRLFSTENIPENERILLIGPESALVREMERYTVEPFYERVTQPETLGDRPTGVYLYEPFGIADLEFPPGKAVVAGGMAAGISLEAAVDFLKHGLVGGLLTCPLNKAMLQQAGFEFPGHTEFLSEKLGVGRDKVCMHLCGHDPEDGPDPKLRVSLVTTHPALKDVPGLVNEERLVLCLRLTSEFTRALGLSGAVAVCGLNPHAGEAGHIGSEEADIILPAMEKARAHGLDVAGPFPADTVFHFAAKGQYPAVLAMYHDQGLGPLKLLHFSEAVNVTLGLPYPRTSPDHGTGYDLVGTGKASVKSFRAAYDMLHRLMRSQETA